MDLLLYYSLYVLPAAVVLLLIFKTWLFFEYKSERDRLLNILYYPDAHIMFTTSEKKKKVLVLQNKLSLIAVVIAVLFVLIKMCVQL